MSVLPSVRTSVRRTVDPSVPWYFRTNVFSNIVLYESAKIAENQQYLPKAMYVHICVCTCNCLVEIPFVGEFKGTSFLIAFNSACK